MKFWQKAFLILCIIFVITLNLAIIIIARLSYKKQIQSFEEKAAGEAYFIANSIHNDLSIMAERGILTASNEERIFRSYSEFYQQQGVSIAIKDGDDWYYNSQLKLFLENDLPKSVSNTITLWMNTYQKEKYVMVSIKLKEPYSEYTLLYGYHLVNFVDTWNRMMTFFIVAAIGITFFLSIILYFVLQALTKPIKELNLTIKEIAEGNYQKRVTVKGRDEFAELGIYFNQMTDRIERNIQELQEETMRKQRLVDNLAHELRTPITAITGYAEYMQMAALDEDEKYNALTYIREESKRLEKLSQVLLLLADIRETKIPMDKISVDLLIRSLEYRFKKVLKEKEIQFMYNGFEAYIYGNMELLEILLSNLLENSIRASDIGKMIQISGYVENNMTTLIMKDNGIGMKEEELKHIMEPFYRVDKARSRKHGGVGLGTALCEQIVRRHQANITYESRAGVGTTVKIIFNNLNQKSSKDNIYN